MIIVIIGFIGFISYWIIIIIVFIIIGFSRSYQISLALIRHFQVILLFGLGFSWPNIPYVRVRAIQACLTQQQYKKQPFFFFVYYSPHDLFDMSVTRLCNVSLPYWNMIPHLLHFHLCPIFQAISSLYSSLNFQASQLIFCH